MPLKSMQLTCTKQTLRPSRPLRFCEPPPNSSSRASVSKSALSSANEYGRGSLRFGKIQYPVFLQTICLSRAPSLRSGFQKSSLRPDRPRLPVIPQRQQSQPESAQRTRNRGNLTRQLERVTQQEHRRAKCSGNRIQLAAFKNLWRAPAQHIADAPSAHGRCHAQQKRRQDASFRY